MHGRYVQAGVAGLLCLTPSLAQAFTVQNAISKGCHERITFTALRAVRQQLPEVTQPIALSGEDKVAVEDAPFEVPSDMRELGATSLVFGVRQPDLQGRSGTEVDELALVHGAPDGQTAHCLRRHEDDDPNGSEGALQGCRDELLKSFNAALDGLDAQGKPDVSKRMAMEVPMGVGGKVTLHLPVFHVMLGQSLHTMQDAFTHHLRTPDGLKTTSVLNWVDWVNNEFEEARDGHEHLLAMDRCEGEALITQRRELATLASIELMQVAYNPTLSREQKSLQAQIVVESYTGYQPGCDASNSWCGAKELDVKDPEGCGCRTAGGQGEGGSARALGALALAGVVWARRRWRKGALALGVLAGLMGASSPAQAEEEAKLAATVKAPEPKAVSGFAFYAAGGVSVDKPGASVILAGRYRINTDWIVGLDAEWNPQYNKSASEFRRGMFNGYGTLIRQYPLKYEEVNLRTTVNLGTSILLMDLVGAPAGKPGIYGGFSPLGIEWRLKEGVHAVIDPLHISMPFPQITGVPYGYIQYRLTIGIELG